MSAPPEPAHQFANRVGERANRRATDLHHGSGRLQRAASTDGGYAISRHGLRAAHCLRSAGTASMVRAHQAGRTST
jgi:hypothetical protein